MEAQGEPLRAGGYTDHLFRLGYRVMASFFLAALQNAPGGTGGQFYQVITRGVSDLVYLIATGTKTMYVIYTYGDPSDLAQQRVSSVEPRGYADISILMPSYIGLDVLFTAQPIRLFFNSWGAPLTTGLHEFLLQSVVQYPPLPYQGVPGARVDPFPGRSFPMQLPDVAPVDQPALAVPTAPAPAQHGNLLPNQAPAPVPLGVPAQPPNRFPPGFHIEESDNFKKDLIDYCLAHPNPRPAWFHPRNIKRWTGAEVLLIVYFDQVVPRPGGNISVPKLFVYRLREWGFNRPQNQIDSMRSRLRTRRWMQHLPLVREAVDLIRDGKDNGKAHRLVKTSIIKQHPGRHDGNIWV